MKKLIGLFLLSCAAAFAQPGCTQIVDTLYSVGVPNLQPMNGYIDLNQGFIGSNGIFVVTQSAGRLTVTDGVINTCQSPGPLQANYSVLNAGPVIAYTKFSTVWTIPGGAGPYTVQQVLGTRAVSLAWTFGGLLCQATGATTGVMACPGIPAPVHMTPGLSVALTVDGTNTGAVTLNLAGLGAFPVVHNGVALTGGEFSVGAGSGNIYPLLFDGNEFNLTSGGGGSGGTPGGNSGQIQYNCAGSFCGFTPTVNGTGITLPYTLNFVNAPAFNGLTIAFSNPANGDVKLGVSGTLNNAGLTNSSFTTSFPSWLTVGSPIALGGALTVTATTGQTPHQVIGTCNAATAFAPCTLVPGDIPTLNQNTTGTAGNVTGVVARANGGLNSSSPGTGILRDGTTPAASELSGDATTSGSNAVTVKGANGVLYSGLTTGLLKNTTTTGVPSIAAAGTDYATATNGTSGQVLAADGAGGFGTPYSVTTSGASSSIPELDSSGNFTVHGYIMGLAAASLLVQPSAANTNSRIRFLPSGTATVSSVTTQNSNDTANSGMLAMQVNGATASVTTSKGGTGTPITVFNLGGDGSLATLNLLIANITAHTFTATMATLAGITDSVLGAGVVRSSAGGLFSSSELSGDVVTSGSNAVTVTKLNGVALAGLATGLLKNTTSTGVPSIAVAGTDYAAATNGSSGQALISNGAGGYGTALAASVTVGASGCLGGAGLIALGGSGTVTSGNCVDKTAANTLTNVVAPATPSTGFNAVYSDSVDLRFHDKNESGVIGTTVVAKTCTNQVMRVLAANGVLTCATITSAFVDTSVAVTGVDINTSSQVTATHLAAALPRNQGGLNSSSPGTGILRDGTTPAASELSGDATTSGSNAVTVTKLNGVSLAGLVTGLLKNTTTTGTPSIATPGVDYAAANAATTPNGQTCTLGSSCNVNVGATAHGVAINEGNGAAIAGTATGSAHQRLQSGGSSADPTYADDRDVKIVPFAAAPAGSAGGGVSYASGQWTATARAGSNNLGAALQAIPVTGAALQFMVELPLDWDSAAQPSINIFYSSASNTSGTVIWTIASGCSKEDGSVSDDPAFNAETAFASQTMAAANRMWAKGGTFTAVTSGNNCVPGSSMIIKASVSGTASAAINAYQAVVTIPTLPIAAQVN